MYVSFVMRCGAKPRWFNIGSLLTLIDPIPPPPSPRKKYHLAYFNNIYLIKMAGAVTTRMCNEISFEILHLSYIVYIVHNQAIVSHFEMGIFVAAPTSIWIRCNVSLTRPIT